MEEINFVGRYGKLAEEAYEQVKKHNTHLVLIQDTSAALKTVQSNKVHINPTWLDKDYETVKNNSLLAFQRYAAFSMLQNLDPDCVLLDAVEKYHFSKDYLIKIALNDQAQEAVKNYKKNILGSTFQVLPNPAVDGIPDNVMKMLTYAFLEDEAFNAPLIEDVAGPLLDLFGEINPETMEIVISRVTKENEKVDSKITLNKRYVAAAEAEIQIFEQWKKEMWSQLDCIKKMQQLKGISATTAVAKASEQMMKARKLGSTSFQRFVAFLLLALHDNEGSLLEVVDKNYVNLLDLADVARNGQLTYVVENYKTYYRELFKEKNEATEYANKVVISNFIQAEKENRPVVDKFRKNVESLLGGVPTRVD